MMNDLIKIQAPNIILQVFPNPASNTISILVSDENTIQKPCSFIDASGREIQPIKLTGINTTVNISDLNPGIYFIKLGDHFEKIMVE
jgi:hypothetical protein